MPPKKAPKVWKSNDCKVTSVGKHLPFGKPCQCMTLEGMRALAKQRGLAVSGTKAELCRRLTKVPCNCYGHKGAYSRA